MQDKQEERDVYGEAKLKLTEQTRHVHDANIFDQQATLLEKTVSSHRRL